MRRPLLWESRFDCLPIPSKIESVGPSLLAGDDVDGGAELVALVLGDLAAANEALEVGVGIGGGVEFTGALLEVGDELGSVFDVGNGAASGAGYAADETLGTAIAEHGTGGGIVRVDDHSVRNHAAEFGIGV